MASQRIKELSGTDGLFTFNFFCESIISTIHTLEHILEHENKSLPENALKLTQALASMGEHLLQDYSENQLSLNRFKDELLNFYSLAFTVHDEITALISGNNHQLQYYYYIYMQGVNLFFPNILQSMQRDLPDTTATRAFIGEITRDFAALSFPVHQH